MATLLPLRNEVAVAYTPGKMVSVRGFTWSAVPAMEILRMYTIVDVSGNDQYAVLTVVLQINDCDNNVCGVMHAYVDNLEVPGCFAA